MGVSNDAKLVFGFTVGEDSDVPDFLSSYDSYELDDFILEKAGVSRGATWEQKKPVIDSCPADLELHCSYDYPMFILCVRGTTISASRGYAEIVDPTAMVVDPAKITAFKEWCKECEIDYQEPKWLLCSMNG